MCFGRLVPGKLTACRSEIVVGNYTFSVGTCFIAGAMLVLGSDSDIKKVVFPVAVGLGKSVMRGVFWRVFFFDGGSLCPNFLLERKNIITVSCFRFSYDF